MPNILKERQYMGISPLPTSLWNINNANNCLGNKEVNHKTLQSSTFAKKIFTWKEVKRVMQTPSKHILYLYICSRYIIQKYIPIFSPLCNRSAFHHPSFLWPNPPDKDVLAFMTTIIAIWFPIHSARPEKKNRTNFRFKKRRKKKYQPNRCHKPCLHWQLKGRKVCWCVGLLWPKQQMEYTCNSYVAIGRMARRVFVVIAVAVRHKCMLGVVSLPNNKPLPSPMW